MKKIKEKLTSIKVLLLIYVEISVSSLFFYGFIFGKIPFWSGLQGFAGFQTAFLGLFFGANLYQKRIYYHRNFESEDID